MVEFATATITNPLDHNNQENALYRYQRDGFLLVPRVFKDNEVDVLREAFCRLNQRGQTLKANATIQTSRFIVSPLSLNDELNAIHGHLVTVSNQSRKFGQDQRLLMRHRFWELTLWFKSLIKPTSSTLEMACISHGTKTANTDVRVQNSLEIWTDKVVLWKPSRQSTP